MRIFFLEKQCLLANNANRRKFCESSLLEFVEFVGFGESCNKYKYKSVCKATKDIKDIVSGKRS